MKAFLCDLEYVLADNSLLPFAVIPKPRRCRLGLFTGWIEIALAALRLARILDDRNLNGRGQDLLRRALAEQYDRVEFDIISGRAGVISALVVNIDPASAGIAGLMGRNTYGLQQQGMLSRRV